MHAAEHQHQRRRGYLPRHRELLPRAVCQRRRHISDRVRPRCRHRDGRRGLQHFRDAGVRCVIGGTRRYSYTQGLSLNDDDESMAISALICTRLNASVLLTISHTCVWGGLK